ncbi:MAG: valine--tRNA ligase [Chlamydiia bacterium]|nr:valine--tRNA ligase [Chlamydiia bacterium]
MSEISKTYNPKDTEGKWVKAWELGNFFHPETGSKNRTFSVVIPPPNVTGMLHMGHALVNTLQDILIRAKRMQGFETLWVPGVDHAGIATQTVVEKKLLRETGKRRTDFPREEFLAHIWDWKDANEEKILNQLKKLGCSCDFKRGRFTMDEKNNHAVRRVFKKLFDEGLIVRGDYLVNWDPVTKTALADDEVEYEEQDGFIWTFSFPVKDSDTLIEIATTRPETMLGDTAVAVNPKDPRYENLIGKMIIHPLTGREIPIIADNYVDPEFGTGAVKITPAHDPNDYEIGLRHNLPFVTMMTPDGKINEEGKELEGLSMKEAREKVIEKMTSLKHFIKKTPHKNRIGKSYRSKAVIEPYISKQWFIKMEPFKEKLKKVVSEGRTNLIPKSWESTYFHWIDNLRDWCISRQLWWGHRIPIWYKKSDPETFICLDQETYDDPEWVQDKDVLDTWFSSALWPFAALGWPDDEVMTARYYPNSTLITGHDILFFWVARMLMMGEYVMENPPFPEVFLHGLIFGKSYFRENPEGGITYVSEEERKAYDLGEKIPKDVHFKWEKMSKSKGNVLDPLEIINEYGADALRMTMAASATHAREIDLDRRKFEEFRNFSNKFWNGARFVFMQVEDLTDSVAKEPLDESLFTLEDKWILSLMDSAIESVKGALDRYEFDKAAMSAYDFFWREFCAYYVEISKPTLFGKAHDEKTRVNKQKILVRILDQATRLIHPITPFITEEIYSLLKERFPSLITAEVCAIAPYPEVMGYENKQAEQAFKAIEEIVYTIRNIRGEMKLPPGAKPMIHITGPENDPLLKLAQENTTIITGLINTAGVKFEPCLSHHVSTGMVGALKVSLPMPEDLIEQEKKRLEKEKVKLEGAIQKLQGQLANEEFVAKAPEKLIEATRAQLQKSETELKEIEAKLQA